VPDTLLEAEFFGVAPGAYTGADRKGRDGKFKLADGGTLFLDEVGDMPMAVQVKLLRALQESEIEPLGSNQVVPFDVRVVAATSRDLPQLVREGRFREDLYYRLHVLPIRVPPLRERRSDIPLLTEALCEDLATRSGMPPFETTAEALALLEAQQWRGNIRELRNVLEQVALRHDDNRIDATGVAAVLRETAAGLVEAPVPTAPAGLLGGVDLSVPLAVQVAALETRAMQAALVQTRGNKVAAARLLGMSRASFYDKWKRWPEVSKK
jgi:transcriptional regulator with GAF, ATPase, and Fis domain